MVLIPPYTDHNDWPLLYPAGCEVEWEVLPSTGTVGGEFRPAADIEECLTLCAEDLTCVAVDVTTISPTICIVHTNQSLHSNDNYTNPVMSQYIIQNRCPEGKRTPPTQI